ncbi:MAG: hypothetical protein JWM88_3484 [Verrucomicrobia bacterium]|nr:hypothetical protein [Verrucomicrobiota bacterium]
MQWDKARRFRRVCPLLVETPAGWRCSVDTPNVRPFWGRFLRYYGGTAAALYLLGALGVFVFLRIVGYPVSIIHVTWPPAWHRVGQARGWYFADKARRAFAANHTAEALLYLSNAYEFDPGNYVAGLTLAKTLQAGQPVPSDHVYQRLYHEHPAQREATAQEWFRALLARGDFPTIQELARDRLLDRTPHASPWMRALVFTTRQSRRTDILRALAGSSDPAAGVWRPLLETELLFLDQKVPEARARLDAANWTALPPYGIYYRIEQLIALGEIPAAREHIDASVGELDLETRVALQLSACAREGAAAPLQQQVDLLLAPRLSLPVIKLLAAQLIRHPDSRVFAQLFEKFSREPVPFNTESAGVYFSFLCAAGVEGDWDKFHSVGRLITAGSGMNPSFLLAIESFFRGRTTSTRATSILPVLPLPIEVTYALIERYPGTKTPAPAGGRSGN